MADDGFLDQGTDELSAGIRDGHLTSATIVAACLRRIESENRRLHAFVKVFADNAMERARLLDAERDAGRWRGPLHGLPVAVKDLIDIEGEETGFGSRSYATGPAARNAALVDALEEAGAIIIGKTHTVEFAFGSWGTNHSLGTPVNPALPGHCAPGGSSGGSAVAVGSGMVPLAIGSDTGGSVRIPAALCGIAGMKPSHGTVSLEGVAPLSPRLDTIGPLARDTAGLRALFNAMRLTTADSTPDGRKAALRVRLVPNRFLRPADSGILARRDAVAARLADSGANIDEIDLPRPLEEYQRRCGRIMAHDAYRALQSIIDDHRLPVDPMVRKRIVEGRSINDAELSALLDDRAEDIACFLQDFGREDILVLPTVPFPAPTVDAIDESRIPMSRFTRIANYLELTAVSLPMEPVDGAPTAIQLAVRSGQDDRLLAALAGLERKVAMSAGA